ncbi:TorD/DmsD family molecular chaperone [Biostraticola tofi]|uniref:TorA maturation chaperone TorD n=1 Tax=Biostraticola tofi TaxID=466109 RepID=A0A4R3Z6E2_9GAMM|nr:molecular chaperone [Biostraticola tofi]TCW00055.1 TorA maturation chaperone TorD [Biostraticola tofi]
MNDFSLVCRVLGNLFYRQPGDMLLSGLMTLISDGKLGQHWPLEQDELLERLSLSAQTEDLGADYAALFDGEAPKVPALRSDWVTGTEEQVRSFLHQRGMPPNAGPADHFGSLVLAASWLEDQATEDETAGQRQLFDQFILPWSGKFLGNVESFAATEFYRTLALICRGALEAMREELDETLG